MADDYAPASSPVQLPPVVLPKPQTSTLSFFRKKPKPDESHNKPSKSLTDVRESKKALTSESSKLSKITDSEKPKSNADDIERNTRHSEVVALMSGTTVLSSRFHSQYKIGDLVGDGAFGFVLTVTQISTNVEAAAKFIIKDKIPKEHWIESSRFGLIPYEIHILSCLDHPNVIKYIDHFYEGPYVILITELHGVQWSCENPSLNPAKNPGLRKAPRPKVETDPVDGNYEASPLFRLTKEQEKSIRRRTSCDLFECIDAHTHIPEHIGAKIFAQIALAVQYMHVNNIVHRDLKDENIVIGDDYFIKLIDFGSASRIPRREDEFFTKFNGTAHFASPEIAHGNPYRGPEAEVWSLGVLLFTIIFGENPFQTRADIIKGEYRFPFKVDEPLMDLLDGMLTYDSARRYSIRDVIGHPWLKKPIESLKKEYRHFDFAPCIDIDYIHESDVDE
ncbi:kinase-like domain-containing protein [Polychytrium aggregatum]|uniref:kinase-like domain-containing protein n=1 Tax=Polychytrium aggregatum TaxID=110093 RepID=UPI0022FF11C2|nr:kinase-like domain-containing protein [Polychytrium aggregatum]KAI9208058.1 kinase-like domain-containing protein [Polychytrium aggregatum]